MTESVWDYPRPPIIRPESRRITVTIADTTIADTESALAVLETSHPPTYYLPVDDVDMDRLVRADHATWCEFKGRATYWSVEVDRRAATNAAWGYESPTAGYEALTDHVAFFAQLMDRCTVGPHTVLPQEGTFYGGWITPDVSGPFKGGPGTRGW